MAKRGLCLLLALATVFSLAVPAFAGAEEPLETPAPTEEPVATEAPVATEEPAETTEEPAPTEVPVEETEAPAVTEEPVEVTEAPVMTEESVEAPEMPAAPAPVVEPEPAAIGEPIPAAGETGGGSPAYALTDGASTAVLYITGAADKVRIELDGDETTVASGDRVELGEVYWYKYADCDRGEVRGYCIQGTDEVRTNKGTVTFYDKNGDGAVTVHVLTRPANACGDEDSGLTWSLSGSTLTISGAGRMNDYDTYFFSPPWMEQLESIRTVIVGPEVSSFSYGGFYDRNSYCTHLTDIYFNGRNTQASASFWEHTGAGCTVHGYTGSPAEQFAREAGMSFQPLEGGPTVVNELGSGSCGVNGGDNVRWRLTSDGVLSITGSGAMDDYIVTSANPAVELRMQPWGKQEWKRLIHEVRVGEGVTAIGNEAFATLFNLVSASLPSSLREIGYHAFYWNDSFSSVTLPEGLETIGTGAFRDTVMTSATVPASVKTIGDAAFCSKSLKDITVLSRDCQMAEASICYYCTDLGYPEIVTVHGYRGSTAEAYCKKYDISFEPLDPAPTQPKLSAVTAAANGVTVSWNAVSGAAAYRVMYKTGAGKWKALADTAETSYTWTKAKSGTKYTFSVQAMAADGFKTGYSKTGKSITYMAQPKVKSAKIDASGVKITWAKVNGAAKYQVMYKTGDGNWKVLAKSATGTSYTWKKAKSGTSYTFSVRAVAKDGTKGPYNETGKSLTYVAAPKLKSAKKVSGGIKITWAKVNGAAKYQVMYRVGNGKWKALTTTDKRTFTWKKAKNGVKYTFSVRAVAADGTKGVYNTTGKSITYKK